MRITEGAETPFWTGLSAWRHSSVQIAVAVGGILKEEESRA